MIENTKRKTKPRSLGWDHILISAPGLRDDGCKESTKGYVKNTANLAPPPTISSISYGSFYIYSLQVSAKVFRLLAPLGFNTRLQYATDTKFSVVIYLRHYLFYSFIYNSWISQIHIGIEPVPRKSNPTPYI